MTPNKDLLNELIGQYNFSVLDNNKIIITEEPKHMKIELGEHYITKCHKTGSVDDDYKILFVAFFNFMCYIACKNRPTYTKTNDGK
ncbi:MAG: hypothetical protein V4666_08170 [Bacteroidota bacterium]